MKPVHDIHIHTYLSSCSNDKEQNLFNILKKAKDNSLKTIGIADHMWDSSVEGASNWYKPQNFGHISKIRNEIPDEVYGIKILFGCESEFAGDTVGITHETKAKLDFVIIPHSHTHMKDFVMPSSCDSDEKIADFLCKSFENLIKKDIATAIAHPFVPVGYTQTGRFAGILSCISDNKFGELMTLAAKYKTGIEINTSSFPTGFKSSAKDEPLLRMFAIAKECGCKMTCGSDAHHLKDLDSIMLIEKVCDACSLTEYDFMQF